MKRERILIGGFLIVFIAAITVWFEITRLKSDTPRIERIVKQWTAPFAKVASKSSEEITICAPDASEKITLSK